MEAGDVARRVAFKHRRRRQDEEIDPHGIPVELAQAGHFYRHRFPGDGKLQHVPQADAERTRQPLFDGGHAALQIGRGIPLTLHHPVAVR